MSPGKKGQTKLTGSVSTQGQPGSAQSKKKKTSRPAGTAQSAAASQSSTSSVQQRVPQSAAKKKLPPVPQKPKVVDPGSAAAGEAAVGNLLPQMAAPPVQASGPVATVAQNTTIDIPANPTPGTSNDVKLLFGSSPSQAAAIMPVGTTVPSPVPPPSALTGIDADWQIIPAPREHWLIDAICQRHLHCFPAHIALHLRRRRALKRASCLFAGPTLATMLAFLHDILNDRIVEHHDPRVQRYLTWMGAKHRVSRSLVTGEVTIYQSTVLLTTQATNSWWANSLDHHSGVIAQNVNCGFRPYLSPGFECINEQGQAQRMSTWGAAPAGAPAGIDALALLTSFVAGTPITFVYSFATGVITAFSLGLYMLDPSDPEFGLATQGAVVSFTLSALYNIKFSMPLTYTNGAAHVVKCGENTRVGFTLLNTNATSGYITSFRILGQTQFVAPDGVILATPDAPIIENAMDQLTVSSTAAEVVFSGKTIEDPGLVVSSALGGDALAARDVNELTYTYVRDQLQERAGRIHQGRYQRLPCGGPQYILMDPAGTDMFSDVSVSKVLPIMVTAGSEGPMEIKLWQNYAGTGATQLFDNVRRFLPPEVATMNAAINAAVPTSMTSEQHEKLLACAGDIRDIVEATFLLSPTRAAAGVIGLISDIFA